MNETTRQARPEGLDGSKRTRVRVGFLPLADCASLVMASELGLDRKHGIELVLSRQASWAQVRDKLLDGRLDMAHTLYGMVYGVQLGIAGPQRDMAVLMTLNRNAQGLNLSRALADQGAVDLPSLAALMRAKPRQYVFAQTYPTGTHAMWLHYWLASADIHPLCDVKSCVIPPPQMVSAVKRGQIDGYSVGEPWSQLGVQQGVAVQAATSQDVWPDHPEKVLATTARFADLHPDTCRRVTMAVLEASRWIDHSVENRRRSAATIAAAAYVDCPVDSLTDRMLGQYDNGMGRRWQHSHPLAFHADGAVNFPYLSDAMWFMTQHKRWGMLADHPDYLTLARRVQRIAIYRDAATQLGIDLPGSEMRSSRLIDGVIWDGSQPAAYADQFSLQMPPMATLQAA